MFSLEDDDYGDMFITQEANISQDLAGDFNKSDDEDALFLGVKVSDMGTPCTSIVKPLKNPMYLDISDDEDLADFQIPCSRKWYLCSL